MGKHEVELLRPSQVLQFIYNMREGFQSPDSWDDLCGVSYTLGGHLPSSHFLTHWLNKSMFI